MQRMLLALFALALIGGVAAFLTFRPNLPAAERGRRLAIRTGCFACHGPGGIRGIANHGRLDRVVPNFTGDVMMYAKSAGELHQWIRDGVTQKKSVSATWREQRERGALRMPAFGRRFSERQISDLVAYVMAMAGMPEPGDSLSAHGLDRAGALGCVGCHGAGGRLALMNPGSLKGYVPSWDSSDFTELVRDSTEFREWVERGVSQRFDRNAAAKFFLRRAVLHMPAFRNHLEPEDVPALWAYVQWLRSPAAADTSPPPPHGDSE